MYGLPADFDASVFIGREIEQVCFSANTISFHFNNVKFTEVNTRSCIRLEELLLTITGAFIHREKRSTTANVQRVPVSSSGLMSLTGNEVQLAEAREDGTLTLHFANGHTLLLLDETDMYESYVIKIGDKEIIV